MRIFVKFFLIVATASVMIFSYKFVIVSDGVKTALSYSHLHFNDYDAAKKNEVISDVEKIYTYRAFGRQFYIFETRYNGLLLESIRPDELPREAFVHYGLDKALDRLDEVAVKVPHWGIFAGVGLVIVLFPSFKKKKKA